MVKLISISELSISLKLINTSSKKPKNYILRYWEKEFKQLRPTIINKRRYYSTNQADLAKLIKFLLKDKGLTINGVKNILNSKINNLDDYNSYGLKTEYYKKNIKDRSIKVLEKIKQIKKYGKKNSFKS